jgi:hypothetical protein
VDTEDDPGPVIGMTGARFGGAPRRKRAARKKKADPDAGGPPAAPVEVAADLPEPDTVDFPAVAPAPPRRSGARQHGAPVPDADPADPGPSATQVPVAEGPAVGLTGARFDGSRTRRQEKEALERGEHERPARQRAEQQPAVERPAILWPELPPVPDEYGPDAGSSAFVRPYVYTHGRTRSTFELSIETLVSAVPDARTAGLAGGHDAVLGLCREPRSVAEVAAHVGVPLGVARVLVGDLAAAGAVAVHGGAGADGPDLVLMQRVLSGLRKL